MALEDYRRVTIKSDYANDPIDPIRLSAGDNNGRILRFVLKNGENNVSTTGLSCRFLIDQGAGLYQDLTAVSGTTTATWEAPLPMGGVSAGQHVGTIEVTDSNDNVVCSRNFSVVVEMSVFANGEEQQSMQDALSDFEQRVQAAQTKINNIDIEMDVSTGVLSVTDGDGVTVQYSIDDDIVAAVNAWLVAHPEATTTVQDGAVTTVKVADGAITEAKISSAVVGAIGGELNKYIGTNGAKGNAANWFISAPIYLKAGSSITVVFNKSLSDGFACIASKSGSSYTALVRVVGVASGAKYTYKATSDMRVVVCSEIGSIDYYVSDSFERTYDVYIAGSTSAHKSEADYVCTGADDDEVINAAISASGVKTVYFYPDSTFVLRAPIVLKSGTTIKSHGATFTQPAMVTTQLASANTDPTSKILRVNDASQFKSGQYVYIQDDAGQNMSNVVQSTYTGGNNSITFVNQIGYQWDIDKNVVLKTANPCIVLDHISDVLIDGIHIDWNVSANPIQTYNPYFLQEGISVQYSNNVTIENCKIENGGRRGICTTDAQNIKIRNCFIRNWHEHAIDIFNGYASAGNTRENPMLNNCIIDGVICTENKMHGIQLHRGSGVVVTNCVSFANIEADISMAEYAHDNVIASNFVHDGAVGIIARTGAFNNLITGNIIKDCSTIGIFIRGVSADRCKRNTVSNNKILSVTRDGVSVEYSDYTRINDNEFDNVASDMSVAKPIICAMSNHSYIVNNAVKRDVASTTYGIRCAGSGTDYNVVKGNVLVNCGAPSTTGTNDVVSDNVVW